MARLSGLQRDVLSLYRECLRALKEKPSVSMHAAIEETCQGVNVGRTHDITFGALQGRNFVTIGIGMGTERMGLLTRC